MSRSWIDYNRAASGYARHREVHPGVLEDLVETGSIGAETRVLDVGCGTGNYARALVALTGCHMSGVEPSAEMLTRANEATDWDTLVPGTAEALPFPDGTFDIVMSTDVIHHVERLDDYFQEAARVLRPGGRVVTVTDSHVDLVRRRPLTSHFPETLEIERQRYPGVGTLAFAMERAGFGGFQIASVEMEYELTDIQPYRDRAFSSLLLLDEAAYQQGMARLTADLANGPIPALSLYTLIWGTTPDDGTMHDEEA